MKIITFSGVDGSGKTTLSRLLHNHLDNNGCSMRYIHSGGFPFGVGRGVQKKKTGLLRYFVVLLKDWVQIRAQLMKGRRNDYIIFDRYIFDSIIKVMHQSERKVEFFNRLFLLMTPEPHHSLYLKVSPEISFGRDNEHSNAYHKEKINLYDFFFTDKGNTVTLDADQSVESLFEKIKPLL